jgi:poly-gamma-glutamate synthesis protein (capsule biosynthesis protein)
MKDIKKAKENADYVIVIYHGGKEYSRYPSPRLLEHSREMILSGANVVLTQHSHCIGCYEEYEGGHILYGQGNFNFVTNSNEEGWYTSLLVGIEIDNGIKMNFYPIYQTEKGMDVATGDKATEIMDAFNKRNQELIDGTWTKGWDAFCQRVAPTYRYCLSPDYVIDFNKLEPGRGDTLGEQVMAHYLDCEAHEDVIKHLYKSWHLTEEL